jgi:hypothetical protein
MQYIKKIHLGLANPGNLIKLKVIALNNFLCAYFIRAMWDLDIKLDNTI